MPGVGNESQKKSKSVKTCKKQLGCQSWQISLWNLSNQIIWPSLAWQPCPFDLQNFEDVIFHLDSIETKILLFFHILFCCLVSLPGMVITDAAALKITQIAARNGKWGSVPLSNRSLMVLVMVWCLKRLVRNVNKTINRKSSLLNLWWPTYYLPRLNPAKRQGAVFKWVTGRWIKPTN